MKDQWVLILDSECFTLDRFLSGRRIGYRSGRLNKSSDDIGRARAVLGNGGALRRTRSWDPFTNSRIEKKMAMIHILSPTKGTFIYIFLVIS